MALAGAGTRHGKLGVVRTGIAFLAILLAAHASVAVEATKKESFRYDFSKGAAPWLTWMKTEQKKTGLEFVLPGKPDPNHMGAAGPLWLLAHLPLFNQARPGPLDLRGATLRLKIRARDFRANGARLSWWIATYIPSSAADSFHDWQQTNWQLVEPDLSSGLDENWRTMTVVIDPASLHWHHGGNNILQGEWANRYAHYPVADTLAHVDATIHLAFVGGTVDQPPEGKVEIADIQIEDARPSAPLASNYDFNFLERFLISSDQFGARYYAKLLADGGSAPAAYHFGRVLKHGLGGPVDEERAAVYLRQAVDIVPEANIELAELLITGLKNGQNVVEARRLLEGPAVLKFPDARWLLAHLHRRELIVLDPGALEQHLRYAAERGHLKAMISLGRQLDRGPDIALDQAEAYFWLRLARSKITSATHGGIAELLDYNLRRLGAAVGEKKPDLDARVADWIPTP